MAAPVGSSPAARRLERAADAVCCLREPVPFRAVGQWYRDFTQVSDAEVKAIVRGRGE
jgi:putative phosphoribosyl transferase